MEENRSSFDRLDSIEATGEENNRVLTEILKMLQDNQKQASKENQTQIQKDNQVKKPSPRETLQAFLKQSKKSWRWFGSRKEFNRAKIFAIVSLILLLVVGLITTIVSSMCFETYSTFTLLEEVWMIFGIFYLVYMINAKYIYEVKEYASKSSLKFKIDKLGMFFPKKEKAVFKVFKWLAIVSVICNVICIWCGMGKTNLIGATVVEIIYLGVIIFAHLATLHLQAQYCIIWVEGRNFKTQEKVTLVLPPDVKKLMTEEEFKKQMPFLCD